MTQKTKWTDKAKQSLNYQKTVAWEWRRIAKGRKFEGPIKLTCLFYIKNRKHGDLSNLFKSIEDGLQYGRAFDNDKQIIRYGESGIFYDKEERAEIIIEDLEGE